MKIAVTGATGFVGRQLIPKLADAGHELVLIGRDGDKVRQVFPGCTASDYAALPASLAGCQMLVNLAAVNNDVQAAEENFRRVNVELALQIARAAAASGVPVFVQVSTTHALDDRIQTPYAHSKREASARLKAIDGIRTRVLYLPAVYSDVWAGKLAVLNRLPRSVARVAFGMLSALKPTVHVDTLIDALLRDDSLSDAGDSIISDGQQHNKFYCTAARLIDLAFAIVAVAFFWWAMLLIWMLVRVESKGPGIFAQVRVGRGGRPFTCYKFRTMAEGTRQAGTHELSLDAVTKVGRFLRATKLDELPQVWNIFRDEIGLVGPRPCLPVQIELVERRQRSGVLRMRPGITGLAQVNDIDMSNPERLVEWDSKYMSLQCLMLDLKIILATATGGGQGDKIANQERDAQGGRGE